MRRPTHLPELLVSGWWELFGNRHWGLKRHSSSPSPQALIRTSCGWGLCCAWCWGGRGDRQPGLQREIRNKWWCGGGEGLAKCPLWPGQCPLGMHLGEGTGVLEDRASGHSHSYPCLHPAWAEVAPRSKRRCVLERKQPYSGDEWCSGPDSEEDDKPIGATHSECPVMPQCCGPWCPWGMVPEEASLSSED